MILPSLLALIAPIAVGIIFGPFTVIALAGSLATGFVLAVSDGELRRRVGQREEVC